MPDHEIRDAIHAFVRLDAHERDIVDSWPIQRLRHVHQLALSYLVYPGATHRRFEHSLGVMELAGLVFDVVTRDEKLSDQVKRLVPEVSDQREKQYWRGVLRIAALCHDIGHPPFSHAAEKALFPGDWSHERMTRALLEAEPLRSLLNAMTPPLRVNDVVKLAVGRGKATDLNFTNWEALLSEIIVGDAFGVDRIDYLLRDSHHAGVVYGRFDHVRLIDTLRILPSPSPEGEVEAEPQLGIEEGGLHAAEALLLARYFMYSQVYFHPIRMVYDLHLVDFLHLWLPDGFPVTPQTHLVVIPGHVVDRREPRCMVRGVEAPHRQEALVGHRSARLSVYARQLLVDRVMVLGKPVAMVATELGVSRATGYKWLRRYRADGMDGLEDRSSRPLRSPRALSGDQVAAILAARVGHRYGPHRLAYLTGHPRSTISGVLARTGMSRLDHADKLTGAPVRYVACHPGALVHQDHKKLGRVPDGGGHRVLGREHRPNRHRGAGYDHFEVFIDDASRLGFVALVDDERPASAVGAVERAAAFYAARGIRIERVLTDNGGAYRSRAYAAAIDDLGARHKRTRPYRPQTNGKAERLIKTLLAEWAYGRPYRSNDERLEALPEWLHFYG